MPFASSRLVTPFSAMFAALLLAVIPHVASAQTIDPPVVPGRAATTVQGSEVGSQAVPGSIVGRDVRIIRTDGFYRDGVVTSVSSTAVVLVFGGIETPVPLDQILRIEQVSKRMRNGLFAGMAAGAGLGIWTTSGFCDGVSGCVASTAIGSGLLWGGVGAGVGVGIGALARTIGRGSDVIWRGTGAERHAVPPSGNEKRGEAEPPRVNDLDRLAQGKKVRITQPDGFRREGVVASVSTATVVVASGQTTVSVPFDRIETVEVMPNRIRKGALIGLAVGAGSGVAFAQLFCDPACNAPQTAVGVALFGGIGTAIGVGVGELVDILAPDGDLVYQGRPRTSTLAIAPILSPARKGIAFTFTWR